MIKIGIPFWKVGDNSFGSTISYIMFAERFGEVVPLMPTHEIKEDLDLLILPGGPDVDPSRYGQMPGWFTGKPDVFKEAFDKIYLPRYIEARVPIFGICRGHQSLAVHFGGKLIQHMDHETNDIAKDPYSAMHDIIFTPAFQVRQRFTNQIKLPVNSRHHQAVDELSLPDELIVLAKHKSFDKNNRVGESDGTVEIIAHTELPIVSFQMHPEDMYEPLTNSFVRRIINQLIATKNSII
jgi:putative glutamine amidotransferase